MGSLALLAQDTGVLSPEQLEAVGAWPWYAWVMLPFVILSLAFLVFAWRRHRIKRSNGTSK